MRFKFLCPAVAAALVAVGFSAHAEAAVVFSNNFDQPDGGNVDSTPVAGQVGGLLATNVQMHSQQVVQPITGGKLNLAWVNYSGTTSVRFNDTSKPNTGAAANLWDFASGSAGAQIASSGGMDVDFDWTSPDTSDRWISFSTGINTFDQAYTVVNAQTDGGVLLQNNGSLQLFKNGANQVNTANAFSTASLTRHVKLSYLFNSWADGSNVTLNVYVDGTLAGTEAFAWDGNGGAQYFELASQGGNGSTPLIDNLVISTAVPEPASVAVLGLGASALLRRGRRNRA